MDYLFNLFWGRFHQHFTRSFYSRRLQKGQKYNQADSLFCAFGICVCKSCLLNVGEIDPGLEVTRPLPPPSSLIFIKAWWHLPFKNCFIIFCYLVIPGLHSHHFKTLSLSLFHSQILYLFAFN